MPKYEDPLPFTLQTVSQLKGRYQLTDAQESIAVWIGYWSRNDPTVLGATHGDKLCRSAQAIAAKVTLDLLSQQLSRQIIRPRDFDLVTDLCANAKKNPLTPAQRDLVVGSIGRHLHTMKGRPSLFGRYIFGTMPIALADTQKIMDALSLIAADYTNTNDLAAIAPEKKRIFTRRYWTNEELDEISALRQMLDSKTFDDHIIDRYKELTDPKQHMEDAEPLERMEIVSS